MVLISSKNRFNHPSNPFGQPWPNEIWGTFCSIPPMQSLKADVSSLREDAFDDHLSDYPFLVGVKTICPTADSSLVCLYWKSFIYG